MYLSGKASQTEVRSILPAGHVVEHRVAVLRGSGLIEDVEGLQGFKLLFLMYLVSRGQNKDLSMSQTIMTYVKHLVLLEYDISNSPRNVFVFVVVAVLNQ